MLAEGRFGLWGTREMTVRCRTLLSVFHMHRLRVSTGKKIFFLILAALAGCPPWPSPDQADSLSWTGLQWRNDMVMKGQWAASHERAMDLLLDLGAEGFESLAGSGTISLDLSVLNPEAALCQVHDVPLNATVESMQTYAAMMLLVSPDQISIQNANHTHINPLMPLSSLLVNGQVELLVIPRDRVGGDCGESSAVPIETMDFEMNAPVYPRDPSRRRVEEQPAPRDRPSRRANERWYCKALVEHLGTGKAVTGTWHPKFQEFTGPTSDDVVSQREAWISDYLHPKPRGAKTGAKFAPTVQSEGRTKRLATPDSMEEVRRAGPTTEQARPGPGRGHVFEPSAPSRLEEPVIIEKMKTTLEHYWQIYWASYWNSPSKLFTGRFTAHITGKKDYCPVTGVPVTTKHVTGAAVTTKREHMRASVNRQLGQLLCRAPECGLFWGMQPHTVGIRTAQGRVTCAARTGVRGRCEPEGWHAR